ncbi:hypothetical protein MHU86_4511 [Fragilaria crotonensis]|nr:hypothetical protein MHU86_4511 [Fragilaria crotonensis]
MLKTTTHKPDAPPDPAATQTSPFATLRTTTQLATLRTTPQPAPTPRKSLVPLPRLPCGVVFPPLPLSTLPDGSARFSTPPNRVRTTPLLSSNGRQLLPPIISPSFDATQGLTCCPRCATFSTISPGSEFRPAHVLAPLLSRHPLWSAFSERITDGAEFPLRDISDAERLTDVAACLARGNHKSARGHEAKLLDMLKDEVRRGWQLPLPKEAALELPHCEVAPLGVVSQSTVGADGAKETKLRLTHDQSFNATRGTRRSVNDRVDADRLTPARFGRALLRFLHYTCKLRRRFPSDRLLITKVDFKSAYITTWRLLHVPNLLRVPFFLSPVHCVISYCLVPKLVNCIFF